MSYYHGSLHDLHNNLPLICRSMKINGVQKLQIYHVIEFDQSVWLALSIEFNTQLRTRGKNDFKKDFFRLINNSVFRKMMENIRKHRDINLVMKEEAYLKRLIKPNFKSRIVFSKNLMGCEMGKIRVIMNEPVYHGQAILQSRTKYFGPKVISYVFVVYLSLFSSSLPPFNVVLFENCYSFTSIFNIEMGGGGVI